MHPAHIPFQAEAQSVILRSTCHFRPCRRFLCDHDSAFISSEHYRIQMFEEFDCLKVLISAIFIRNPLSILFAVIEIQHRCHGIHTEPVHMVMLDPEQGIGNKEILHFRFAIIKDLCSPVRMLSFPWIRILKSRRTVKFSQTVCISREMSRHPVKDDTDIIPVQFIDHIRKVFRCPVSGSRSIISCHLISPGSVKGMFRHSHQLHMSVSHVLYVFYDRIGKFPVCIESFVFTSWMPHPRPEVYLID